MSLSRSRRSSPPAVQSETKLKLDDDVEVRRRAIWHDVRSVLAAATTNVEYIASMRGLPAEALEVAREVENEIRLAADVIEIVTSSREASRRIELDLRACLWVARRSGVRIMVDATTVPFSVRGSHGLILNLVDAIVSAIPAEQTAEAITHENTMTLRGLDATRAAGIAADTTYGGLDLDTSMDGEALVLRRRG